MCPKADNVKLKDLFNNDSTMEDVDIEPKQVEKHYLASFKNKFGRLPEWNMQEQGRNSDWPISIKCIRLSLCGKKVIEPKAEHQDCAFMMLYHSKYNKHCGLLNVSSIS